MIINSSLKTAIVAEFNSRKDKYDEYELLATEIIFYKYLTSFISSNQEQSNGVSTLVSSYAPDYLYKFTQLKNKYTSYLEILSFLKKNNYTNNLLSLKEADIDYVYSIYKNSKKIEDFSIDKFSQSIYGAHDLNNKSMNYLQHVHTDVLVPIIKYYMKFYKVQAKDMKIVDSNSLEENVGKRILFNISGIPISVIYSDIIEKKFPIEYHSINIKYPNIELISK